MSTIAVDNIRPSLGGTTANLMDNLIKAFAMVDDNAATVGVTSNVSSIDDNSSANYDFNLTNNMSAADYPILCAMLNNTDGDVAPTVAATTTADMNMQLHDGGGGANELFTDAISGTALGDLA